MICLPISWHLRGGMALVGAATGRGQVLHLRLLRPLHRLRAADGCLAERRRSWSRAWTCCTGCCARSAGASDSNDSDYRGGAAPRLVLQRHSTCRFKLTLKCSVLSLHSLDALAFTAWVLWPSAESALAAARGKWLLLLCFPQGLVGQHYDSKL